MIRMQPPATKKKMQMKNIKIGLTLIIVVVVCLYALTSNHQVATAIKWNIYPEPIQKTTTEATTTTTVQTTTTTTVQTTTTTTPANTLTLDDITHTIKTSRTLHATRDEPILLTWFRQVAPQSYLVTDDEDLAFRIKALPGHVVVTRCPATHARDGLNCKMNAEFDAFVEADRRRAQKWWCHWDDDNYVNTRALVTHLEQYDWRQPWYIGRASLTYPQPYSYHGKGIAAWFAHGGCGFCVSQPLVKRMIPLVYGGKLTQHGRELGANDDCTVGFVINYLLGVELTQSTLFNSHFHRKELLAIPTDKLKDQISLSYTAKKGEECAPVIDDSVKSFPVEDDPTRFYSVHCLVHPDTPYCKTLDST